MNTIPKILLVDDNPDNLKALEVVLRGLDAELIKVTNGNDALKATLHHDFALALLDIQMPEMDGYELANILKTEEKTENLPFIFISAVYTDHQNITKGYSKGAYNFFAKPFDPETLVRSVELFLDKHNRLQDQALLNKKLSERTKELELNNDSLEKTNRELQSFLHIASHDLKEPLRKIQTFSSRISEDEEVQLSLQGKKYFGIIQNSVSRMQLLIDDLLTYSKTNETDRTFHIIDLNEMMKDIQDDFKEILEEKSADLVIVGSLCKVNAIPFQLRQLLHNLISNSIKYSCQDRTPFIRVSCSLLKAKDIAEADLSEMKDYCHISITDNGIGFDPIYKEKIFEVFQRLHTKEKYSGTGIGLAIVKRIVENHKGAITVTSEINDGSTFNIYLPIN